MIGEAGDCRAGCGRRPATKSDLTAMVRCGAGRHPRKRLRLAGRQTATNTTGRWLATFGLHASLTLSDDTLKASADEADRFHIHVAEHPATEYDSVEKLGPCVVERLHGFGIRPEASWRTASTWTPGRRRSWRETGTFVTHQPRSEHEQRRAAARSCPACCAGMPPCLGNDGFSNDMFAEMKVADIQAEGGARRPAPLGADKVLQMAVPTTVRWRASSLKARRHHCARRLRRPDPADYYPTTPLSSANLPAHPVRA